MQRQTLLPADRPQTADKGPRYGHRAGGTAPSLSGEGPQDGDWPLQEGDRLDLGPGGAGEHGCLAVHASPIGRDAEKNACLRGAQCVGQSGHRFSQDLQNGAGWDRGPGHRSPWPVRGGRRLNL
ncbi:hypothetical protein DESC_680014 [Desulfosarcina cetonica]|nr:hypothetical protein DESC_680014 [Desulfosarcina cetonica]